MNLQQRVLAFTADLAASAAKHGLKFVSGPDGTATATPEFAFGPTNGQERAVGLLGLAEK